MGDIVEIKDCCRLLIKKYIKEYEINHTKDDTYNLIIHILENTNLNLLPDELQFMDNELLVNELGNIVLEEIRNSKLPISEIEERLICIIFNNKFNNKSNSEYCSKNQENNHKRINLSKKAIRGIALFGTFSLLTITAHSIKSNTNKSQITNLSIDSQYFDNDVSLIDSINNVTRDKVITIKETIENIGNTATNIKEKLENYKKEYIKIHQMVNEMNKKKILYSSKKYNSIDDILKRQKELESLNLSDEDKIYKDCKLSAPLQWFIYELSIMNEKPIDLTFSIIHTETRGEFNSSNIESYNGIGNYDLGLTQQNSRNSLHSFCKKYNIDYNDEDEYKYAYKLVRDNDYVNLICCFLNYQAIDERLDEYNAKEYAGYYNGWINWEKKEISRQYVDIFSEAYGKLYTLHHNIESKNIFKKEKKKYQKMLNRVNKWAG